MHKYHLYKVSKALIRVTRHCGCIDTDTELGCDSGGWFKMSSLVADIISRPTPHWARSLRRNIGYDVADEIDKQKYGWERMIVQALPVDQPHMKVRFQYLLEGLEHEDGRTDPQRIATVVKPQMLKEVAGFFHFTTTDAIDGILKKGHVLGKEVGTGRADIHFMVFHPLDSRNTAAYKKVNKHKGEGTSMVIIANHLPSRKDEGEHGERVLLV